ncbi:MAG: putative extracellular nuclease, partial [Phenylobacterium sp.]
MNHLVKKTALAAALALSLPATVSAEIMITEYVEGSSSNKALEITNMGATDIDMGAGAYKLALFGNGDTTESPDRKIDLTGVLAAGASFVVYNASAAAEFQFPDQGATSELTFFNGDDAIVLSKGGVAIDSFGRVGERPADGWLDPNDPNFATKEKTLRRKASVTTGDAIIDDVFPSSPNEWLVFDQDTADGLGCGGETACSGTPPPPTEPPPTEPPAPTGEGIIITEYVEGFGNNKVVELSNLSGADIDMTGYRISNFKDGALEEDPDRSIDLTGVLAAGQSYMIYNEGGDPEFVFPENGIHSALTFFNGNDSIVLTENGAIVDSFGKVGEDPGRDTGWTDPNDPNFATVNKVLRRKASIGAGDTVANDAFPGSPNQWVVFEASTFDGLGCPGEGACGDTPPPTEPPPTEPQEPSPVVITEYIEGSSSNKAIEITNFSDEDIDMGEEGYKLALFGNGSPDAHPDRQISLTGVLFANSTYVVYNDRANEEFQFPHQGATSQLTFFNGDDAIV